MPISQRDPNFLIYCSKSSKTFIKFESFQCHMPTFQGSSEATSKNDNIQGKLSISSSTYHAIEAKKY